MAHTPHRLVAGLLATATVVTLALGWAGWQLVGTERALGRRHLEEQTSATANALVLAIRERLTSVSERLQARLTTPEAGAPVADLAVVLHSPDALVADRGSALPFIPWSPPPLPPSPLFADAESAEFGRGAHAEAARIYGELTRHHDPAIRAGALARLGRLRRNSGDVKGALTAGSELSRMGLLPVDTTGWPAELVGLDAQRLAYRRMGDAGEERRQADEMRRHLDAGDWPLTRGDAEFYRTEVSSESRPEGWLLANALTDAWPADMANWPPEGYLITAQDNRPVVVLWQSNGHTLAMGAAVLDRLVEPLRVSEAAWQITDAGDQYLAGVQQRPDTQTASRVLAGTRSAYTLHVWPTRADAYASTLNQVLLAGLVSVVLFIWGATFFIARAIRREAEVARLQTEFVAAVSHEFRSPLTTMRQMVEMLHGDRVPGESRRQQYYGVLVSETGRLQRLVETLLNFGRLEAGAAPARLTDIDTAALVEAAVADVRGQVPNSARHVDIAGADAPVAIRGEDALRLALRNLIDNAIKYSPSDSTVRVQWGTRNGRLAIDVIDEGPGIAPGEQAAIFRKFVRGQAAVEARVPGTGVGLAMVQRVATEHGGNVSLTSAPGRGSTFTFWLPAAL